MLTILATIAAFLQSTTGIITSLSALILLLWKGGKWVNTKAITPIKTHLVAANKFMEESPNMSQDIKDIKKQLFPNGGTSLADQISHLRKEVVIALGMIKASLRMADVAFWVSDKDGRCVEVSPKLSHITNLLPEQLLGNGWINCIADKDKHPVQTEWNAAVAQDREFKMHYHIKTEDGEQCVDGFAVPLKDDKHNTSGFIGWLTPCKTDSVAGKN